MLITVKVTYTDGTTDIKECHDISEIPLDNVDSIKIIRSEDESDYPNSPSAKTSSSRRGEKAI